MPKQVVYQRRCMYHCITAHPQLIMTYIGHTEKSLNMTYGHRTEKSLNMTCSGYAKNL